jgi:hypothetical protein
VAGADLGTLPLVATLASSGVTNGAYSHFTDVAMVENIVLGGEFRLILNSENQRLNVEPTQGEEIQFDSGDDATDRIRLIISDSENFAHIITSQNEGNGADTDATSFAFTVSQQRMYPGILLMVVIAGDTAQTITQSAGPTMTAIQQTANGTACQLDVWARVLDGAEATNVFTFGSEANDVAWVWFTIGGHAVVSVTADIPKGTVATGADASPNPPDCNPAVTKDWLWIECFAADDDDESGTPLSTNYSMVGQSESAQSSSSCMTCVGYRKLRASSENPGVMAMAATEEWVAQTFAIPPAHSLITKPRPDFSHMLLR